MKFTSEEIFERYPKLMALMCEGTWRKYEIQDILDMKRGEVDLVLGVLTREGIIKNTSLGWTIND